MTTALITGVTGQDGYYLVQQCLAAGEKVYGLVRWRSDSSQVSEIQADLPELHVIYGDLTDEISLRRAVAETDPDVVYNLAAFASSGRSWSHPLAMADINATGVIRLLEAIRTHGRPDTRFVQASTSEQFGWACVDGRPLDEATPFQPAGSYAAAKTMAHHLVRIYRESYGLHASTALMFNHTSYRRNDYFVDRKITRGVAAIKHGQAKELRLGRTDTARDWGWSEDFMRAWPLIAAQDQPGDYVIGTGQAHTVAEFVAQAFAVADLDWRDHVVQEPYVRPTDLAYMVADPSRAAEVLGWSAQVTFREIVDLLTRHDLEEVDGRG